MNEHVIGEPTIVSEVSASPADMFNLPMVPLDDPFPGPNTVQEVITRTVLMRIGLDHGSHIECDTLTLTADHSGVDEVGLTDLFNLGGFKPQSVGPNFPQPHSDFDIDLSEGGKYRGQVTFVAIMLANPNLWFNPDRSTAIMGGGTGSPKLCAYDPQVLPATAYPKFATFKVYAAPGNAGFSYNLGVFRISRRPDGQIRRTEIYWDPQIKNDG